jgi:DNA polymerase (family X)
MGSYRRRAMGAPKQKVVPAETDNFEIARVLEEIGDLLQIQGGNPFRVRAYQNAARLVRDRSEPITDWIRDERPLTELPGIGPDLAEKIATIARTGDLPLLKELQTKVPKGLRELLSIPNLGPKRALALFQTLGVRSRDDLLHAAREGKLRKLPGFGPKSEEKILRGIETLATTARRLPIPEATPYAEGLRARLAALPGVSQVEIAGSFRRFRDTVGDLDVLVTTRHPKKVMESLATFGAVEEVLLSGPTKTSVRLKNGLQVDLRAVPSSSYGAALLYFTGSKDHGIALRRLALKKGLKINEYGLWRGKTRVAGKTEREIYEALGLVWIPPELREARGEIELAQRDQLPKLVELSDLKGDLHSHTTATDGRGTLEEMAQAAKKRGYSYLAITDHSKRVTVAGGLNGAELRKHWKEIDRLNAKLSGIQLLRGVELDILEDGTLDLPDRVLAEADWVIASVHYGQRQSKEEITRRVLKAIRSPYVSAIAHPTGRLIGKREPYEIDFDTILQAAADYGCALEANGQPMRLDLNDSLLYEARERGVSIVIDSDAHTPEELSFTRFSLSQARRAGFEADQVWNTLPLRSFLKAAKRKAK